MSDPAPRDRTGTGLSQVASSLRRRVTESFAQQSNKKKPKYELYQDKYGLYNGMTWQKLKGYLEKRFPESEYPGLKFVEQRRLDFWVFQVPELLNDNDKDELMKLRDQKSATSMQQPATNVEEQEDTPSLGTRRSVTPE